eukprot:110150_1
MILVTVISVPMILWFKKRQKQERPSAHKNPAPALSPPILDTHGDIEINAGLRRNKNVLNDGPAPPATQINEEKRHMSTDSEVLEFERKQPAPVLGSHIVDTPQINEEKRHMSTDSEVLEFERKQPAPVL